MSIRTQRNSLPLLCLNFKKTLLVEDWYEHWLDDFDDAILRPEWLTHYVTPPGRTITENTPPDETITIAVLNGTNAKWFNPTNTAPKMYIPLDVLGPCRITTKINSIDGDPPGNINDCTAAGIFIGTAPEGTGAGPDVYKWMHERNLGSAYDGLRVRRNNASWAQEAGVPHPICPVWLRINITADGVIHFEWSQDGVAFDEYDHLTVAGYDVANSFVGIYAENNVGTFCMGNIDVSAIFEYFLVEIYEAQHPIEEECLAPIDTRAPTTFYDGRIKQLSSLKRAVDDKTGLFQIADMSMTLANEDKHYSQIMASRFLKNQEATLYHALTEEDDDDKIEVIKLIVEDHSMKGPDFIIKFKDITQKYFTKKVPENICTKDDFPWIHPDHEGRCMPEILGNASLIGDYEYQGAVEAVYVNTTGGGGVYWFLASASIITIPTDEVWVGDDPTPLVEGVGYDVVYEAGHTYIKLYADPGDESVSFNAHGYTVPIWDSVNGYIQNLAYIIQYYLRFIMDIPHVLINSPSFATLAGYYEDMGVDENCYLILQDRVDGMELLRQLLFTGGAKGFMAMDGKFNVQRKNICNWEIDSNEYHIFEQIELFGSPNRKWNLTSAINTVNVQYGLIPWQDLFAGAKSEYRDNRYERPMEDDIRDREIRRRR